MSTAPFPRTPGPWPVPQPTRSLSADTQPRDLPDLTIHRITKTHHGRTLLTLGHAAEHLARQRQFLPKPERVSPAEEEAIHILMHLSRMVFEEYAEQTSGKKRMEEILLGGISGLLNRRSWQS